VSLGGSRSDLAVVVEDEVVVVKVFQPPGAVWMSSFILQRNTEELPAALPAETVSLSPA